MRWRARATTDAATSHAGTPPRGRAPEPCGRRRRRAPHASSSTTIGARSPRPRIANSSASRVLPTPPGPTTVTQRCSSSRPAIAARSASRPMNAFCGSRTDAAALASLRGSRHELRATLGPELALEARDVALDGAHRNEQLRGDLGVAQAPFDGRQHRALARTQCLWPDTAPSLGPAVSGRTSPTRGGRAHGRPPWIRRTRAESEEVLPLHRATGGVEPVLRREVGERLVERADLSGSSAMRLYTAIVGP